LKPTLGLLALRNGRIAPLLGSLPGSVLLLQLAFDLLPLILGPPDSLLVGDPVMRQLGL
jgi:hypothetical protein